VDDPITKPPYLHLSFVACVSSQETLHANLLASACLHADSPHEVILVKNCPSAADGLNLGIERAKHDLVVCLHQDVWLPAGWDRRLCQQLEIALRQFGPIGVAGVYGVGSPRRIRADSAGERAVGQTVGQRSSGMPRYAVNRSGRVVHNGRTLLDGLELPARVSTLDELLLVLPRDAPLRFDRDMGFHLYGADICLQARERGLAAVVLDALCHHNTRTVSLPKPFFRSAQIFARKWAHRLPVATPCVVIDEAKRVWVLGGARRGQRAEVEEQISHHRGHGVH
jgi:Glycosyltransferase like family